MTGGIAYTTLLYNVYCVLNNYTNHPVLYNVCRIKSDLKSVLHSRAVLEQGSERRLSMIGAYGNNRKESGEYYCV